MRRIGVLMNTTSDDREGQAGLAAFSQALQKLGWTVGRQVQIDTRWGENNEDLDRRYAAELIALRPDVFLRQSECRGVETRYGHCASRVCDRCRP